MRKPAVLLLLGAALLLGSGKVDERQAAGLRCLSTDDEVRVPGGHIRLGSDAAYPEEAPSYETRIRSFRIDRHEVTNRQFARFVAATGHVTQAEKVGASILFVPPEGPIETLDPRAWWRWTKGADWRHPGGPGTSLAGLDEHPVVHVAYADALAYARWAGRVLPSEEQFEYAARAGAAESPSQPEPVVANTWQGRFPARNERADGYAGTAPAGCYRPNAYGLNDMIGNVWEWTASPWTSDHGAVVELGAPQGPATGAQARVIKGGSFLCAPNYCARYRPSARHAQEELSGASHLGFRTVAVEDRGS